MVATMEKSIILMGLMLFAVSGAKCASQCPNDLPKNQSVGIPHETDCSKYYVCFGNVKIERICPIADDKGNRLHFDQDLQVCDWPDNVLCNLSNEPITLPILFRTFGKKASIDIPTTCPLIDSKDKTVHIAHENDCTKFYKCSWTKRFLQTCPIYDKLTGERLFFNPELQVCDWPWNFNCKLPLPYREDYIV